MKATVLYVGSSLLAPLKNAEREINHDYELDLDVAAYNFGAPLDQKEWTVRMPPDSSPRSTSIKNVTTL